MINAPAILKDEKLQSQLNELGFVKIPLADAATVQKLQKLFDDLTAGRTDIPADILYTCLHNSDKQFVSSMNEGIEKIMLPLMQNVLKDFQNTSFTFQIKGLGKNSELYAHQDWSFSDENRFRTYTFWLTLHDSHPENGTVYLLKRSHQKLSNVRGAGIPAVFEDVQPRAMESMEPMYIKAGELIIFDSALGHFSPPNFTSEKRVSVMTNLTHKDADFMLYFGKQDGNEVEISSYKVPHDFLMRYDNFKSEYNAPPKCAEYLKTEKAPLFKFSKDSLEAFLNELKGEDNWFVKLKRMVMS